MNEDEQGAFVVCLVKALANAGWVGKTHIQKGVYFAQEAAQADLGFKYVIHYYGPYSRELEGVIQSLGSRGDLRITPEDDGYGYSVTLGEQVDESPVSSSLKKCADSVAKYLGGLNTLDLERLSTAFYVRNRLPEGSMESWIQEVHRLKPKFNETEIAQALKESLDIAEAIKQEQS